MLFKMVGNESAPDLNRDLLSKFSWLRRANHVKLIKECAMRTKKYALVKKKIFEMSKTS